jgi:hypothetical protein
MTLLIYWSYYWQILKVLFSEDERLHGHECMISSFNCNSIVHIVWLLPSNKIIEWTYK